MERLGALIYLFLIAFGLMGIYIRSSEAPAKPFEQTRDGVACSQLDGVSNEELRKKLIKEQPIFRNCD